MMTAPRRALLEVLSPAGSHWVGDGFPVRTLFSYGEHAELLSPFLLLDHAGPEHFPPATRPRGVGAHPHRGFETVTIVYSGEVAHRDSGGGGGLIGPGDVQWMTAASGLVHEEFHGPDFTRTGGRFEVIQLWINLPAREKMGPPRYQEITADMIPQLELADGAGRLRVLAGSFAGTPGPAHTVTPLAVWDMDLSEGHHYELAPEAGHTAALVVLRGRLRLPGGDVLDPDTVGVFDRSGGNLVFDTLEASSVLLLAGEPLAEPVVGSGPFVMNTAAEIHQAIADYRNGRMGRLDQAQG